MKWGKYSNEIEIKLTKLLTKAISVKGLYILLVLAALVLLSGANEKWGQ